jgi:hypothetical protein
MNLAAASSRLDLPFVKLDLVTRLNAHNNPPPPIVFVTRYTTHTSISTYHIITPRSSLLGGLFANGENLHLIFEEFVGKLEVGLPPVHPDSG